ncbi:MAG: NAD(P)-dependent oxidoreductase [Fusobacteriaceae bacterium]|jgi:nucleoside-diphosphate-sugar epimerase|nr:NAD(P)-dependent oxidoreductase [Fusobacteriaceae bacterium]
MQILITGATSFIGIYLIKELLLKYDCQILAVVRKNSKKIGLLHENNRIKILELNMNEYSNVSQILKGKDIDCLIHLAWNGTRGNERDDQKLQEENYEYSMILVKEILKLNCKKIVSAGSQAEYGIYNKIVSEEDKCIPVIWYGKEKLKFYENVYEICKINNVSFKEPRFFSLYGVGDNPETMIISILKKMLRDEDCDLTEGIQMWDFLYITDAVKGICKLIFTECKDGIYNFGSGDIRILKKFIMEMKEISKSNSKLNFGVIPYLKTGMVTIQPNIYKLKKETGWYPKIIFKNGIRDIILNMGKGKNEKN